MQHAGMQSVCPARSPHHNRCAMIVQVRRLLICANTVIGMSNCIVLSVVREQTHKVWGNTAMMVATRPSRQDCMAMHGHGLNDLCNMRLSKPAAASVVVCWLRLGLFRHSSHVHDVVAAYQYLAQVSDELAINEFLRARQLQVHVRVDGHEVSLILHSPLKLHDDLLAGQIVQERLRVDRHHRGHGASKLWTPIGVKKAKARVTSL
mmetsp:Transcript_11660/g.34489  ORF Transcript_11660/g.34489 Transcript_11660/m.34489 type:complete len:206 (-) Transcript_11660:38-655(-)